MYIYHINIIQPSTIDLHTNSTESTEEPTIDYETSPENHRTN